jgi:cytochrome c oxidase assembly factor CtaG
MSLRARGLVLLAGGLLAVVAISPPAHGLASHSLTAHMVQNLLVSLLAPALVVIGSPLLHVAARPPTPRTQLMLRIAGGRTAALVTAPLLGWALLPVAQLVLHTTPLLELGVRNEWLHLAELLVLFACGLLFWRPVLGADPLPRLHPLVAVAYLLAAMPANDVVGVWLMSSRGIEYASFAGAGLADQHRAGAVMLSGSFLLGAAALASAWRWVQLDHRRTTLGEAPN